MITVGFWEMIFVLGEDCFNIMEFIIGEVADLYDENTILQKKEE